MVILSKHDQGEMANSPGQRELYHLLLGGGSHVRHGSLSNTPPSNESNAIQASPPVPLTTIFPPLSIARVRAIGASRISQPASDSNDIQPIRRVVITEVPNQRFDPSTFDPTNLTLREVTVIFRRFPPGMNFEVMSNTLLKYSLSLHEFPPCPREDLMLAVYFYLEKFGIQNRMTTVCIYKEKYPGYEAKDRIGILFDRIQAVEYALSQAQREQESEIKVKPNKFLKWILIAIQKLYL